MPEFLLYEQTICFLLEFFIVGLNYEEGGGGGGVDRQLGPYVI